MKVILIDDERLALDYLEHYLMKINDVEVIGKFVDPIIGKEKILHEGADVVFLDINLPEINGIELAEQILETKPNLNIVFVTAYEDHAVKAFELNALDYVVKPIGSKRLMKTMERIRERLEVKSEDLSQTDIQMRVFRQVSIATPNEPFISLRWRTSRAQELFLYLLQNRGQLIRKFTLIELLWPEYEPKKAFSQLYTTIYHIRKTLEPFGNHFQISSTPEGYILDTNHMMLDVEVWENQLNLGQPITSETIHDFKEMMSLYSGDYLQEYDYLWAEGERHRLKLLWLRTSFRMAKWYSENNESDNALGIYLEIANRYPIAEEAHFELMKIYASMNNPLSVNRQYSLLTRVLEEEINEKPSPYIREWYNKWNQGK